MKNLFPNLIKLIVLISIIILPASCREKSKSEKFSFAFISDIHLQTENNAVRGFLEAVDTINDLNPDFVITGGDMIIDALGQRHGEKMFENRFGESYYSFNHKGWKFMIINSIEDAGKDSYIGLIDQKQIGWIRDELQKTDPATPIVLSTHIPFITAYTQKYEGTTLPNDSSLVIINGKEVIDLFKGYNLKLVLQGHLHTVEDIFIDGIHFVTGGAVAAGWWRGPNRGFEEGFVLVKVKGKEFNWEFVDYKWTVQP